METIIQTEMKREDYYEGTIMDIRNLFINYGHWLERNGIENEGSIDDYVQYLNERSMADNIKIVNDFVTRLYINEYKVILYNGQTPILEDNTGIINIIINDLNDKSIVEFNGDILTIHNEEEIINLIGYKDVSDGEIFARQYLDTCEYGDLIIKDYLGQVKFEDINFKNAKDYYSKCKAITNIRTVPEDSEHYKMNCDCIIVGYGENDNFTEEIWQRA
jgi:hypothetical protein